VTIMLTRPRRVVAALRAALSDALDHCDFLERRRDHWRALYKDLEGSLVERARFVAEDESGPVARIAGLEREVAEQRAAADQFRKRACDAEAERDTSREINLGMLRHSVSKEVHEALQAELAEVRLAAQSVAHERDAFRSKVAAVELERDAARAALAEERAARAGLVPQGQAA
jgi:hypothetical protein